MIVVNDMENESQSQVRILLVDDDDDLRYTMAEYLNQMGFDVVLASDGDEALELFNKMKMDVVISDVRMPRMSGIKLLRHVKSLSPKLPMILMTGFELSQRDLANIRYNADAYVTKPFSLAFMKKTIDNLLKK